MCHHPGTPDDIADITYAAGSRCRTGAEVDRDRTRIGGVVEGFRPAHAAIDGTAEAAIFFENKGILVVCCTKNILDSSKGHTTDITSISILNIPGSVPTKDFQCVAVTIGRILKSNILSIIYVNPPR